MGPPEKARKATYRSDTRDNFSGDKSLLGVKNKATGDRVSVDEKDVVAREAIVLTCLDKSLDESIAVIFLGALC